MEGLQLIGDPRTRILLPSRSVFSVVPSGPAASATLAEPDGNATRGTGHSAGEAQHTGFNLSFNLWGVLMFGQLRIAGVCYLRPLRKAWVPLPWTLLSVGPSAHRANPRDAVEGSTKVLWLDSLLFKLSLSFFL